MVKVKRFTAEWCQPCRQLAPLLEQIQIKFSQLAIFEVIDVDKSPEETQKYLITSVPTVIIEKDGQVAHRFVGLNSANTYLEAIKSLI